MSPALATRSIAVLALCMASGLKPETAVELANIAAGIVVGKVGTVPVEKYELLAALAPEIALHGEDKVVTREELVRRVALWKANGERVVFTNGCFDLLHIGHITLLEQARRFGDRLIVAINSDASVRGLKGPSRPIVGETRTGARAGRAGRRRCGGGLRRADSAGGDRGHAARRDRQGRRLRRGDGGWRQRGDGLGRTGEDRPAGRRLLHHPAHRPPYAIVFAPPICILAGCERSMKMLRYVWESRLSVFEFTCIRGDGVENVSPK